MFLIVGLGNPGHKYKNTRHNIGFEAIDRIAKEYNIKINRAKFKGEYGEGVIGNEKVLLLKPTTYMNLSGESVKEVANFYKLKNENILVIYDDISLDVGKLRLREKGSAGGHNGIKSIISELGTDEFPRIKIGVGQPKVDLVDYVLGVFSKQDLEILDESLDAAAEATQCIIEEGMQSGMNKFNGFSPKKNI